MRRISRHELKRKLDRGELLRLVAVLNPWRFRAKHIPGSMNFSSLEFILATISPQEEVVLYCTGRPNVNSSWAYRLLREHGYRNVWLYEGGLNEWEMAGNTLVGPKSA